MKLTGSTLAALSMTAVLVLWSGCHNFGDDDNELKCDSNGCLVCEKYTCYEYACGSTNECPQGYSCQTGSCLPATSGGNLGPGTGSPGAAQCTGTMQCPTGKVCEYGLCVDPTTGEQPDTQCTMSTQCDSGHMCIDGACVEDKTDPVVTPDLCHVNADCEAGQMCHGGECVAKSFPLRPEGTCQFNADCGTTGTCMNTRCYFPPTVDDAGKYSCPFGAVNDGGLCLPNLEPANECSFSSQCGAGKLCVNATCLTTCAKDADCSTGNFCGANSLCILDDRPILQCLVNSDCADSSCVDGRCLTSCTEATADLCGEDSCTPYGFCMPTATCFEKADCAAALDCINGRCDTFGSAAPPAEDPVEDPEGGDGDGSSAE